MRDRARTVVAAIGVLLLSVACATAADPTAAGASGTTDVHHVSPAGDDAARGDATAPWRTLRHALGQLRAGDVLVVADGTYVERIGGKGTGFLGLAPGTPAQPVVVRAAPGASPVLKGLLWLSGMDHWTFDDIDVTWDPASGRADEHMVRLRDGVGWTYQNAEIWGARSFANVNVLSSTAGEPSGWALRGNCIRDNVGDPSHGTAKDQLLYVHTGLGAGPGLIERNLLFGAPRGKAVKIAGPTAGTGSIDVTVRHNTIVGTYKPPVNLAWATARTLVERNLIGETAEPAKGLVRAFELSGAGNRTQANYGWGAHGVVHVDAASTATVAQTGDVLGSDPAFDRRGCDGFRPGNPAARAYGRWAPEAAPASVAVPDGGSVDRLYRAYFLRAPDPGGLRYWRDLEAGGMAIGTISEAFALSPEFRSRYGAVGTGGFVDLVYANVLGRVPDPGGRAHWLGLLERGLRRGDMMVGFSESPEFRARVASGATGG